jgi:catechol 2,3-dioxygenase-like lactoylglutathione lyase family enzyme
LIAHKVNRPPKISALDHVVLTVADINVTSDFYERVLGAHPITFGEGRRALQIGQQKINLHPFTNTYTPKAQHPTYGSADLCFLSGTALATWLEHLAACGIAVITGPVPRTGATGPIESIYLRDPDGNLIEIANLIYS